MPQLDIMHISMIYVWSWFIMIYMTHKIKTVPTNKLPGTDQLMKNIEKKSWTLPWT